MRVFCLSAEVERKKRNEGKKGNGLQYLIATARVGKMKSRTMQTALLSRLNITLYSVDAINSLEKCAIRLRSYMCP